MYNPNGSMSEPKDIISIAKPKNKSTVCYPQATGISFRRRRRFPPPAIIVIARRRSHRSNPPVSAVIASEAEGGEGGVGVGVSLSLPRRG